MDSESLKKLINEVNDEMKALVDEYNSLVETIKKAQSRQNEITKQLLRLEGKGQAIKELQGGKEE